MLLAAIPITLLIRIDATNSLWLAYSVTAATMILTELASETITQTLPLPSLPRRIRIRSK